MRTAVLTWLKSPHCGAANHKRTGGPDRSFHFIWYCRTFNGHRDYRGHPFSTKIRPL